MPSLQIFSNTKSRKPYCSRRLRQLAKPLNRKKTVFFDEKHYQKQKVKTAVREMIRRDAHGISQSIKHTKRSNKNMELNWATIVKALRFAERKYQISPTQSYFSKKYRHRLRLTPHDVKVYNKHSNEIRNELRRNNSKNLKVLTSKFQNNKYNDSSEFLIDQETECKNPKQTKNNYPISDAILNLAKPRLREPHIIKNPKIEKFWHSKKWKRVTSVGLNKLSMPKNSRKKININNNNNTKLNNEIRKTIRHSKSYTFSNHNQKTSKRIQELAQPKRYKEFNKKSKILRAYSQSKLETMSRKMSKETMHLFDKIADVMQDVRVKSEEKYSSDNFFSDAKLSDQSSKSSYSSYQTIRSFGNQSEDFCNLSNCSHKELYVDQHNFFNRPDSNTAINKASNTKTIIINSEKCNEVSTIIHSQHSYHSLQSQNTAIQLKSKNEVSTQYEEVNDIYQNETDEVACQKKVENITIWQLEEKLGKMLKIDASIQCGTPLQLRRNIKRTRMYTKPNITKYWHSSKWKDVVSMGIRELARPRIKMQSDYEAKLKPTYNVPRRVLRYKATERILELAQPKNLKRIKRKKPIKITISGTIDEVCDK